MPLGPVFVHVLTALGVVCALMAALTASSGRYEAMFVWLGLAFLIDGVDGPIARFVHVKERLPRFSGERLDLVIDYLTYVFVPVLALLNAGLLAEPIALATGAAILLSSLYHFADTASKADDNSFVGFPAIWNVVALYLFVFQLPPWVAVAICLVCVALTFVPTKWVHPMRVATWRPLTLAALALWSVAAAVAISDGFGNVALWCKAVMVAVAVYAVAGLPLITTNTRNNV